MKLSAYYSFKYMIYIDIRYNTCYSLTDKKGVTENIMLMFGNMSRNSQLITSIHDSYVLVLIHVHFGNILKVLYPHTHALLPSLLM